MLSHPKITPAGSMPNPRVARVLSQLGALNSFRRGELSTEQFEGTVGSIFLSGIVYRLFLFHIARPWDWPIADQHVFRAYAALFDAVPPETLGEFGQYRNGFAKLAEALRRQSGVDEQDRLAVTQANKRLDDALFAYGQFLLVYDR
jgi:hypothetical protein